MCTSSLENGGTSRGVIVDNGRELFILVLATSMRDVFSWSEMWPLRRAD
jgi:hypothetical protein